MRLLFGSVLVAAGLWGSMAPSQALPYPQTYPWCARLNPQATTDCAYVTRRQCELTIRGVGGWCERNLRVDVIRPRDRRWRHYD